MGKGSDYTEQPLFGSAEQPVSLGRYALRRQVDASSSGTTWVAYDTEADRDVAVTLMPTAGTPDDDGTELADRARAWQRVDHPNVAKISEVGMYLDPRRAGRGHEGVFVVRESFSGVRLRRWLELQPPGPKAAAAIIDTFCTVGRAITAAHRCGIVHGDGGLDSALIGFGGEVEVVSFDVPVDDRGRPLDARDDQYQFCAALQAALNHHQARMNRRLRGVLIRGMAPRRDDRFSSMETLVARLEGSRSWLQQLRLAVTPGAAPPARGMRWAGASARRAPTQP